VVGPMSDAERDAGNRKIKAGFLLLVAVSPPLIALQWGATPVELLAALGAGIVLGALLVWYLGRLADEFTGGSQRPGRRR
jgi:membrane protein YqaA with SNARE-associated domain